MASAHRIAIQRIRGVLLAADAFGAPEFVDMLDRDDNPAQTRLAHVGFIATINGIGVTVLFTRAAIASSLLLGIAVSPVVVLLLAPAFYPTWRLTSYSLAAFTDLWGE
jgi:hypothetical protein